VLTKVDGGKIIKDGCLNEFNEQKYERYEKLIKSSFRQKRVFTK
jgi:hypothetical protein